MINSKFNPTSMDQMDSAKVSLQAIGIRQVCPFGAVTSFSWTPIDDYILTGFDVTVTGALFPDVIAFQIIDPTGFTGVAAGTVLRNLFSNWNPTNGQSQYEFKLPLKIIANLQVKFTVTSNGTTNNLNVGINLHAYVVSV